MVINLDQLTLDGSRLILLDLELPGILALPSVSLGEFPWIIRL